MLESKKQTLNILVFIHQKLVASPFYPEEFVVADKALKLIAEMAQSLDKEISDSVVQKDEPVVQEIPQAEVKPIVKRGRKAKQA